MVMFLKDSELRTECTGEEWRKCYGSSGGIDYVQSGDSGRVAWKEQHVSWPSKSWVRDGLGKAIITTDQRLTTCQALNLAICISSLVGITEPHEVCVITSIM